MESRPVAPTARAAMFAAVCTLLAVAAHSPMSGRPIPLPAMGLGLVLVFCFSGIAVLGERGLASITALVSGSQLGLHVLFAAVQTPAAHSMAMPMPTSGMPGMAPHTSAMGLSPGMTAGHAIAAAVAAWWLRRGEAAVHRCARSFRISLDAWVRRLCLGLRSAAGAVISPSAVRGSNRGDAPPPTDRLIRFAVVRRGPPATV